MSCFQVHGILILPLLWVYYEDYLVIPQGPDPDFFVHQNFTVSFQNIFHGRPDIPTPLLGPFACNILLFTYQSMSYIILQVLGTLVCMGHDNLLFLSTLSSDDIFFLSIIGWRGYHLETGIHSGQDWWGKGKKSGQWRSKHHRRGALLDY